MSDEVQDVIVIGGGLAGLTAARELRHAGRRVLVLEARDRLGGRAYTSELAGHDIELGGAFVHWFQPHVFAEMSRYGLAFRVPPEPERYSYRSQGRVQDGSMAEVIQRLQGLFDRVFADARERMPLPYQPLALRDAVAEVDHLSVQDRIDTMGLSAEERDLVNGLLTTACSAPCSDAALTAMMRWFSLPGWNFGLMLDAVAIFGLRTADLVNAIVADGNPTVRTSAPVATVEQHDSRVTVVTRQGEAFTGWAAVVAVPLNTLGALEFVPGLAADKQLAVGQGQAGRGVKLWAQVRGMGDPVFYQATDDQPITSLVTEHMLDDGGQLLVAFGPDGGRLSPTDEQAVREALSDVLPPGAIVEAVTGHNWRADEFSQGTWSVFRPGQLTGSLSALQAPHGRVVFAGADIADGWNGFLDGAIESGLAATRSVSWLLAERPG